jgi:hypothetical protein
MKNNVRNEVRKMIDGLNSEDEEVEDVEFFKSYDPKLVFNYSNSLCAFRNNLVVMQEGQDSFIISRFSNPTWLDYLKGLKEKES